MLQLATVAKGVKNLGFWLSVLFFLFSPSGFYVVMVRV
jgi:hypothetical protein